MYAITIGPLLGAAIVRLSHDRAVLFSADLPQDAGRLPTGRVMTDHHHAAPTTPRPDGADETAASRGRLATVWNAVTAAIGVAMGLLPHVLHHAALFAGAALITTTGGNLLFGAVGLLLSVPLLRRLYRRFGTWKAPAAGIALFAVMFSLSAFVIGPAISGSSPTETPEPGRPTSPAEHTSHHPD